MQGDMLTVNNHRCLHGRDAFELNGGTRHLIVSKCKLTRVSMQVKQGMMPCSNNPMLSLHLYLLEFGMLLLLHDIILCLPTYCFTFCCVVTGDRSRKLERAQRQRGSLSKVGGLGVHEVGVSNTSGIGY